MLLARFSIRYIQKLLDYGDGFVNAKIKLEGTTLNRIAKRESIPRESTNLWVILPDASGLLLTRLVVLTRPLTSFQNVVDQYRFM